MASELKNLYLICGDEQYLKEKKKKELLKLLHTEGSLNFNAFDGKEIDRAEIARLADTMPFMEEHRTLLLSDTGFFKGSAPQEIREMLETLPESTVLLFYEEDADAANALYKLIKERGTVFSYKKMGSKNFKEAAQDQGKIRTWAVGYLKKAHREISGRAMTRLLQLTGYDMLNLQSELEKLISYTAVREEFSLYRKENGKDKGRSGMQSASASAQAASPRAETQPADARQASSSSVQMNNIQPPVVEIREQDIEAVCSKTVTDKVFDMLSAKLMGNTGTALQLFEDLLSLRVPPLRVLFLLGKQFNQVYLIKEASRERIGDAALSERIGIKDWQLRKLKEQGARLSLSDARRYLELCVEMETKIKLGDMNEKLGVEIVLAS